MVEQEILFDKEKLKNKRTLKGTPLYRLASRYAKYFAVSLGCVHVTLAVVTYYLPVSKEFLTQGQREIERGSIRLGMFDRRSDDTKIRFEQIKEDIKLTTAYSILGDTSKYIESIQKRYFSEPPAEQVAKTPSSPVTKEEQSAIDRLTVKEASK